MGTRRGRKEEVDKGERGGGEEEWRTELGNRGEEGGLQEWSIERQVVWGYEGAERANREERRRRRNNTFFFIRRALSLMTLKRERTAGMHHKYMYFTYLYAYTYRNIYVYIYI